MLLCSPMNVSYFILKMYTNHTHYKQKLKTFTNLNVGLRILTRLIEAVIGIWISISFFAPHHFCLSCSDEWRQKCQRQKWTSSIFHIKTLYFHPSAPIFAGNLPIIPPSCSQMPLFFSLNGFLSPLRWCRVLLRCSWGLRSH